MNEYKPKGIQIQKENNLKTKIDIKAMPLGTPKPLYNNPNEPSVTPKPPGIKEIIPTKEAMP
jgi:hypothetical protein